MMVKNFKIFVLFGASMLGVLQTTAQSKFKIGGLGRGETHSTYLGKSDTVNNDVLQRSNALFDLGIEAELNEQIAVSTIVRFKGNLNYFEPDSSQVNVRQIRISGKYDDFLSYELGDIDLEMTPYTLFNTNAEGDYFESDIFSKYRGISSYENFNVGNKWRQQGARVFGDVNWKSREEDISYQTMFFRTGATDGIATPDRFAGGGSLSLPVINKLTTQVNYLHYYSDYRSVSSDEKLVNGVGTVKLGYSLGKLAIEAEAGQSNLMYQNPDASLDYDESGEFFDFKVNYRSKDGNLSGSLGVRSVSDDFISPGAQAKRYGFGVPNELAQATNNGLVREAAIFDLVYDYDLYNRNIGLGLDAFNPKFGTATPYGTATPNRQGISLDVNYKDSAEVIQLNTGLEILQDVTGEGTDLKRSYTVAKLGGKLDVAQLIGSSKAIDFSLGLVYNKANRNDALVAPVDLSSVLVDAGVTIELVKNLKFLLGVKQLTASGTEYIAIRDEFNAVTSFDKAVIDVSEMMLATGLRYEINDQTYIMANYQGLGVKNNLDSSMDYGFSQYYILFNIKF